MAVAATKAGGVGYVIYARTHPQEKYGYSCGTCTSTNESTGAAVVLARNVLSFLGGDNKERRYLCWFLGTFRKFCRVLNIIPWLVLRLLGNSVAFCILYLG